MGGLPGEKRWQGLRLGPFCYRLQIRAENPFCWLLEATSCAFTELHSPPWQLRQTPGEMRGLAENRSLYFEGSLLVYTHRFC